MARTSFTTSTITDDENLATSTTRRHTLCESLRRLLSKTLCTMCDSSVHDTFAERTDMMSVTVKHRWYEHDELFVEMLPSFTLTQHTPHDGPAFNTVANK